MRVDRGLCGACETGTVDSRDAVDELTGRYSRRVPVSQAPHPLSVSTVSVIIRFSFDGQRRSAHDPAA
jgi:hypothetical protein